VTKDLKAILYTDGETNRSFSTSDIKLKKVKKTTLLMKPAGGFVMKFDE
jgi:hypothetical protein